MSPEARPTVSIIVPSFNQGAYIRETLLSILAQDYRPLEVLVMDGGSKDDTVAILREMEAQHAELIWRSEPDKGPADAVNKGLALARGAYACIQSSDDVHYPGAISAAMAVLLAQPRCGMAYGDCDSIEDGQRSPPTNYPTFSWPAFFGYGCCWPQGSIVFSTALARELGGWRARYYACDLDFWLRMAFRTQPQKVAHVMYGWRRYAGQRTNPEAHARITRDYRRMIQESDDLRRATPALRRLARASIHIMMVRFHPTGSLWSRRWHLLVATLLHPGHWRHAAPEHTRRLVPGFGLLQRVWHSLRGTP